MFGKILRAVAHRNSLPRPPFSSAQHNRPHAPLRAFAASTVVVSLLTATLAACADPAGVVALRHDAPPSRSLVGNSSGIETIAEYVPPNLNHRTLAERLQSARRSPLIPIDISLEGVAHSGEFVHPDLVVDGGHPWLMFTGYPVLNSAMRTYDARQENPALLMSDEWSVWRPPLGGTRAPLFPAPNDGYNSDGSLLVDPVRGVYLAFNRAVAVRGSGGEQNILEVRRSLDRGATWSPVRETLRAPSHRLVSPDFLMDGTNYQMWSVDAGADGCRAKRTSVTRYLGTPVGAGDSISWSKGQIAEWVQPGWIPWHIDVSRIGDHFFGLAASYPAGSNCSQIELFAALSADGVRWLTLGEPIERLRDVSPETASLYRASSVYDPRTRLLTIAFSAATGPTFAWDNFRRLYDVGELLATFRDFGNRAINASMAHVARPTRRPPALVQAYRLATRGMIDHPR